MLLKGREEIALLSKLHSKPLITFDPVGGVPAYGYLTVTLHGLPRVKDMSTKVIMPHMPGMSRLHRVWQNGWKSIDSYDCGRPEITTGLEKYRAQLPPRIASIEILGLVTDETGAECNGANGRSSTVGGHAYFCLNNTIDSEENTPDNTIAIVADPDGNPLGGDTFTRESQGVTKAFLPMTELEWAYGNQTGETTLLTLPGGMCETHKDSGQAYVWYQKWIRAPDDNGSKVELYMGTGVGSVTVDAKTGNIAGRRLSQDAFVFPPHEPGFGTFCAVDDGNWFYAWGKQGESVYLARVTKWTPTQSELYEFWDGYQFTPEKSMIAPVFTGYSHGTVFRTNMFGSSYKWAFVGLSERGERTVDIGIASDIWGPYQMSEILRPSMLPPKHEMTSSLFVHTWAFREEQGQVMITWNDENTGKITGAKLQFAMLHMGTCLREISLSQMPCVFSGLARGRKEIIEAIARQKRVYSEVERGKNGRAVIRLMGNTPAGVTDITAKICDLISNWRDEVTADDLNGKLRARKLL